MKHSLSLLAPHFSRVDHGSVTVWFSYAVPIGVSDGKRTYTRENEWSTATGTHLNQIDNGDKASRQPTAMFERTLEIILGKMGALL